jgi:hypothetical protein
VTTLPSYLQAIDDAAEPKTPGMPRAIRLIDAPAYRPPKWLIRDFWPANLLGLLVGDGGTFKSSLALHMAGAVAGGYTVFDRYQAVQQPVLIVSAEDDEDVMRMRLEAFVMGHGWDKDRVLSNVHVIATPHPVLGSQPWRRHLDNEINRTGAGFVILDPWADLIDGDENSNSEIRPAVGYLRGLMASQRCTVAVVHHMGKAAEGKRTIDRVRGASAFTSASRVLFAFEWHDNAVHVENLKMSRMEKIPTFVLERTIRSANENRMLWEVARVATKDAGDFRFSEAKKWVVRQVAQSPGIGTRDLRKARDDSESAPNTLDIGQALKSLVLEGYIAQTPGKQNKQHLTLTASGSYLLATFAPGWAAPAATSDSEVSQGPELFDEVCSDVSEHTRTHSEGGL